MTDRQTDRMSKALWGLRAELEEDPQRLSVLALNKAILQLLENQVALMSRLATIEATLQGTAPPLTPAAHSEKLRRPGSETASAPPHEPAKSVKIQIRSNSPTHAKPNLEARPETELGPADFDAFNDHGEPTTQDPTSPTREPESPHALEDLSEALAQKKPGDKTQGDKTPNQDPSSQDLSSQDLSRLDSGSHATLNSIRDAQREREELTEALAREIQRALSGPLARPSVQPPSERPADPTDSSGSTHSNSKAKSDELISEALESAFQNRARDRAQDSAPGSMGSMGSMGAKAQSELEETSGASTPLAGHLGTAIFPEVRPVSDVYARVAIRAFDKRDNDFQRGLDLLNSWLCGPPELPGMPFQIRREQDLGYINVTNLTRDKILEREANMKRFLGFDRRLGLLAYEGLKGEVWLYTR